MLDFGAWGEFLVIAAAAVVLLKPDDLPKFAVHLAKIMRKIRSFYHDLQEMYQQMVNVGQIQQKDNKNDDN